MYVHMYIFIYLSIYIICIYITCVGGKLKLLQVTLLYKFNVKYLKCISNEVSDPSAENILVGR